MLAKKQRYAFHDNSAVYHLLKSSVAYRALPAKVSNQVLIQLHNAWVAFFKKKRWRSGANIPSSSQAVPSSPDTNRKPLGAMRRLAWTVDELDVHNLTMVARVNGEEWSRGSSSTMMWQVEEIIAYVSKGEGVQAGELIGSGTVGWGCGLEPGKLLKPGDVVELEIEGIGVNSS